MTKSTSKGPEKTKPIGQEWARTCVATRVFAPNKANFPLRGQQWARAGAGGSRVTAGIHRAKQSQFAGPEVPAAAASLGAVGSFCHPFGNTQGRL